MEFGFSTHRRTASWSIPMMLIKCREPYRINWDIRLTSEPYDPYLMPFARTSIEEEPWLLHGSVGSHIKITAPAPRSSRDAHIGHLREAFRGERRTGGCRAGAGEGPGDDYQ